MDYHRTPYGITPYGLGAQSMGSPYNKMPFYMSYPPINNYQDELEYEREMDKMKRMYPKQARLIQQYVDEECDKMEYEGSQMFDEYPDQVTFRGIAKRICDKMEMQSIEAQHRPPIPPPPGPPGSQHPPRPYPPYQRDFMRDLVEIMLFNEIYRRRCRFNRCRRWW